MLAFLFKTLSYTLEGAPFEIQKYLWTYMTTTYFHGKCARTTAHTVPEETVVATQLQSKNVSKIPNTPATKEESPEVVFSLRSVPRLHNEGLSKGLEHRRNLHFSEQLPSNG
jgi:hypothetical protein